MGPGDLARALCGLELISHPDLIVGLESPDDAGVFRLTEELALVQTVDFFTPIVDDPHVFGQVAAANALSDVYAMGGTPLCAMNLVAFPIKTLGIEILREILRGGLDKLREAGVVLVGGHSIDDPELKYGLSVTGTVHPARVRRKRGGRPGDRLVLTKPLGTGLIGTALKRGQADPPQVERMVASMCMLNNRAADLLGEAGVTSCTDVTGFGLLGHACEMVEGTAVGLIIHAHQVPLLPGALRCAEQGLRPGGLGRNQAYRAPLVQVQGSIPPALVEVLFDPQTSGGLLATVPAAGADALIHRMHDEGLGDAALVGEVVDRPAGCVVLQ